MILIISSYDDTHALAVAKKIQALGYSSTIFDLAEFGAGAVINYSTIHDNYIINSQGERLNLTTCKTIWYRRPSFPSVASSITDIEVKRFVEREWRNTFEGLFMSLNHVRFVNPIQTLYTTSKVYQLSVAKSLGFTIPPTIVTNSKQELINFYEKYAGQIIHKALTATKDVFIDTRLLTTNDFTFLDTLVYCPVIFQQHIQGKYDIRATIIGDKIFAAKINTHQNSALIDSRLDLNLPFEIYEFSDSISSKIRQLMSSLSLKFATLDFKIGTNDDLYFLEVNPQGQFIYVELLTGLKLVDEMAHFLITQALE